MTDLEAVTTVAARAWELAREFVFPGHAEFLKDFDELAVEGRSFRVEVRLQQDALGWDNDLERTMIALRFARAGEAMPDPFPPPTPLLADSTKPRGTESPRERPREPWTLYIRGYWPERTDRLARVGPLSAKTLRKVFSPRRRREDDPHRDALMSEDIYVMETTPPDDLTAQLCLFLLQTGLSDDPKLFVWLENYLVRTFHFRVQDRKDVARDMIARMLRNKWWTEDPRAWRKYVARLRVAVERRYLQRSTESVEAVADPNATEDRLISVIESPEDYAPDHPSLPMASSGPYDRTGAVFTSVDTQKRQLIDTAKPAIN